MVSHNKMKILIPTISTIVVIGIVIAILCIFLPPKNSMPKFQIQSVQVTHNGTVLDSFDAQVFDEDVKFDIKINDGINDLSNFQTPQVSWAFEGDSLDAVVSNNGVVDFGNTLGDVTLVVCVTSENSIKQHLPIHINPRDGTSVQNIVAITKEGFSQTYVEGQKFNKESISVWGDFGSYDARLSKFEVDQTSLTTTMTEIFVSYKGKNSKIPVFVNRKNLQSIEILTPPEKISYVEGQTFQKTGMKIRANYEFLTETLDSGFIVDEQKILTTQDKGVVVSFTYNNITKTVLQNIIVLQRKLVSISVEDSTVLKEYVQGDIFDPTGLTVTANFEEIGSCEIKNFVFDKSPLMSEKNFVEISYTENGITAKAKVEGICVEKPYATKRQVSIDSKDVKVSWIFSYVNDDGEKQTDNTAYQEHGLLFDETNGQYEIPVGAILNLRSMNSSILDFEIDGQKQNTQYPNNQLSLKITKGEPLQIGTVEVIGNRIIIIFEGEGKKESFSYSENWNGALDTEHYNRLGLIFADTAEFYHQYKIGEETYTYSELKMVQFSQSCNCVVSKVKVENNVKEITLHIYDQHTEGLRLEMPFKISDLPTPQRSGYAFVGWAKSEDGIKLDDESLQAYIEASQQCSLYALWNLEEIDYSSSEFVGTWKALLQDVEQNQECEATYTFNADGTFSFVSTFNGTKNLELFGFYRIESDSISVIDVRYENEILSLASSDFKFEKLENMLMANVFLSFEQLVSIEEVEFIKV